MKYHAFISYSHADKVWGDWLHKALETYRVPKALVGRATSRPDLTVSAGAPAAFEAVPARAYPIFRDREELPTATDLGEIINAALRESRDLIVICSPRSAQSQWVNQEILAFKRLGRENRILALIVDGEPNAADGKPGFAVTDECFPEALKFKLGPDGNLSTTRTEPIAADARDGKDGKPNALLKLLAGVLGVAFDDLRQRDAARRRRRRQLLVAAALVALAGGWFVQSRFATEQRERIFQVATAELGRARQLLNDNQPAPAVAATWQAIQTAKKSGRKLDSAWWVLRRALDANRVELQWQAAGNDISELAFDPSGERLLTFASAENAARLWSVADARELVKLPLDPGTDLVVFTANGTEIVSVRSWFKDAESYYEKSSAGIDLTWWNPTTGAKLRALTVPDAQYFSLRHQTAAAPKWIATDDHSGDRTYRLVRLDDGWSKQTLPIPKETGWGAGPELIPDCGVVLLVDPSEGVKLFTLGENASARGHLGGISATEKLRLSHFVPAADRTAFSALVWTGEKLLGAGVWRASDGARLSWHPCAENEFSSSAWLGPAGPYGLTGHNEKLIQPLAAALGRKPLPPVSYEATGYLWHETPGGPVTLALQRYGSAMLIRPAVGWHTELASDVSAIALSPDGRLAATGNERGQLTLWRTDAPFDSEPGLPPGLELVTDLTIQPDGAPPVTLLRAGPNRALRWDIAARRVVAEFDGIVQPPKTWLRFSLNPSAGWLVTTPALPLMQPVPDGWQSTFHDLNTGKLLGHRPAQAWQLAATVRRALAPQGAAWQIVQGDNASVSSRPLESARPYAGEYATTSAITPDGRQIIVARGDGLIEVFAADTGASQRTVRFATEDLNTSINSLTVSPSGRWTLLGTYNRWWRIDLHSGAATEIFANENRPDGSWQFLDGDTLLIGTVGSMLKWWKFPELTVIAQTRLEGSSATAHLSADGQTLSIKPDWEEILTVVDRTSGAMIRRFTDVRALSADATLIAVNANFNGTEGLRIIRVSDGEILAECPGLRSTQIAFAPDHSRIAIVEDGRLLSIPITCDEAALAALAEKSTARPPP